MFAVIISAITEWETVVEKYSVARFGKTPYGDYFFHEQDGEIFAFFHGGWAKTNAAASAQYIIDRVNPRLVVNLGTCGGFAGHAEKGEILIAEKTLIYDIYDRMFDPDMINGEFTSEIDLTWLKDIPGAPARRTLLISGDSDLDPAQVNALHQKYGAVAGDWESAAIAHVCKLNNVPLLIARGVSDLVSEEGGEAYDAPEVFAQGARSVMANLLDLLPQWVAMFCERNCD